MLILRLLIPFAFGYFMSYLFRVVNAVTGPHLSKELSLDSGQLGLLTSVYFLTFAASQLPLGILLDRYGPRRVEALFLLFAAAGAATFASASGVGGLIVGRALIGFGVSACLMGAFKAYSEWFPAQRLPLVNGIHLSVGGLGALAGGVPVEWAINTGGWRPMFLVLAAASFAASVAILFVVPKLGEKRKVGSFAEQFAGIKSIITSPAFYRVAPLCVASQSSAMALQTLWAGPWLQEVGQMSSQQAATTMSIMAAFLTAGFLGLGSLPGLISRYGYSTLNVAVGGMMGAILCEVVLVFAPVEHGPYIWYAFAFFGSAGILCYPALTPLFAKSVSGRVNTTMNFLMFTSTFTIQWLVGEALDFQSAAGIAREASYDRILLVIISLQCAGLLWLFAYRRNDVSPAVAPAAEPSD